MARVTMELRKLLETDFVLFDFPYPCDDPTWKTELEKAIIDYYYFHEIGEETPDRWKHKFRAKMQLCMGYYNKLHNSELLDLGDPLIGYRMAETLSEESEGSANNNSTSDTLTSEYPLNLDTSQDIPSGRDVTKDEAENTSSAARTSERVTEGNQTPKAELLQAYRKTLLRLNERIIAELKPLFILIY